MNSTVEAMPRTEKMTDPIITMDMLISSKTAVKTLSTAITESVTPQVRDMLKTQLNDAIMFHEKLSAYAMAKGYYDAYNINSQIQKDMQMSQHTLSQL